MMVMIHCIMEPALLRALLCLFFLPWVVVLELECGFPGMPKNGALRIKGENLMVDNKFTPGTVAEMVCDENWPNTTSIKSTLRVCGLDGRWNDTIPRCVKNVSPAAQVISHHLLEDCSRVRGDMADKMVYNDDWMTSCGSCLTAGSRLEFRFDGEYDVRGVQLVVPSVRRAATPLVQLRATLDGSIVDRHHYDDSIYFSLGDQRPRSKISVSLIGRLPYDRRICEIRIFAFEDQCGHPEVPADGFVKWLPDKPMVAVYGCRTGFRPVGRGTLRHCAAGQWLGEQFTCQKESINDVTSIESASTQTSLSLVATATVPAALLVFFFGVCCLLMSLVRRKNRANVRQHPALREVSVSV